MQDEISPLPPSPGPDERRRLPLIFGAVAVAAIAIVVVVGVPLLFDGDSDDAAAPTVPNLTDLGAPAPAGDVAPDFSVETSTGGTFRLSHHLATDGRPVFLNLWASWCFPCRAEMPALDAASMVHPEVLFLGVSVRDDSQAAAEFAEEIGVTYTLGFDDGDEVDRVYPALGLPATYLITSDGQLVRTIYGQVVESQIDDLIAEHLAG